MSARIAYAPNFPFPCYTFIKYTVIYFYVIHLLVLLQSLSDAKLDLRTKEQEVRQLNKHLSQLESDNTDLLNNVKDAEMALRTSTR